MLKRMMEMDEKIKSGTLTEKEQKQVKVLGFTAVGLSAIGLMTVTKSITKRVFRRRRK